MSTVIFIKNLNVPEFRYLIGYINPSKFKNFRIIINENTQLNPKLHVNLHISCHIDIKHQYLMVYSQLILIKYNFLFKIRNASRCLANDSVF